MIEEPHKTISVELDGKDLFVRLGDADLEEATIMCAFLAQTLADKYAVPLQDIAIAMIEVMHSVFEQLKTRGTANFPSLKRLVKEQMEDSSVDAERCLK